MVGSPRSGTTWLANLLTSLTGGALIDEPLIGAHLATPVASVIDLGDEDGRLLLDRNAARPAYFFSDATSGAWLPALRALLLGRFGAQVAGSGPVIIKEPNGSGAAPLLLRAVPRSRLLFVVRDGRDVVDSLLDGAADGWITETHGVTLRDEDRRSFLLRRAHHWVRSVEAVERAFQAHDPALRMRVTYESVLSDTQAQVQAIVRWLGQSVEDVRVREAVDRLSFDALPAERKGTGQFARSATPGLWRDHLTPEEQRLLWDVMGDALVSLGYEKT